MLLKDYFSSSSLIFNETNFERQFRMPVLVFDMIINRIIGLEPFIKHHNSNGSLTTCLLYHLFSTLCLLIESMSANAGDKKHEC